MYYLVVVLLCSIIYCYYYPYSQGNAGIVITVFLFPLCQLRYAVRILASSTVHCRLECQITLRIRDSSHVFLR